jgi:hypothetical protein
MYKIILDNKIIDVVRKPRFLKLLKSGFVAITDKSSANGIAGSDNKTIYSLVDDIRADIPTVIIEEIDLDEFSRLDSLLNSGADIIANAAELNTEIDTAIENLSQICRHVITSGFSVLLSDGKIYKFKLTVEDQINLLNLENQLNAGENMFIYHATGSPCQVFKREDMQKIICTYRKFVRYHTTYFNAAKRYVSSLTNIDEIKAFSYGTDISSTVSDVAVRQILLDGEARR